jgi:hypothetical protein
LTLSACMSERASPRRRFTQLRHASPRRRWQPLPRLADCIPARNALSSAE